MNDLTLPNASHLAGQRRLLTSDSLQGLGFSQPRHVSREGGQFTLVDDTGEMTRIPTFDPEIGVYIDMVIVDTNPNKSKIFYDPNTAYKRGEESPPLCWSDNGVAPSINAMQPQSITCDKCPQNKRGSAIGRTGAEVTACKDRKKFAVLVSGFSGMWQFVVPAASLRHFRDYVEWTAKQVLPGAGRNADVADMITRAYFVQGDPNILNFRGVGIITPQIAALQDKLWQSGECDVFTGRLDQPRPAVGALAPPFPGADVQVPPISLAKPTVQSQLPAGSQVPPPPQTAQVTGFVQGVQAGPGFTLPPLQPVSPNEQQQPRRQGRPKKQPTDQPLTLHQQAGALAQPQGGNPPTTVIPTFLDRRQNPSAPPPPKWQFGVVQDAPTPAADIQAAVADAFKLA